MFLFPEVVETSRWTEDEMDIAKQGKALILTHWSGFLAGCLGKFLISQSLAGFISGCAGKF